MGRSTIRGRDGFRVMTRQLPALMDEGVRIRHGSDGGRCLQASQAEPAKPQRLSPPPVTLPDGSR